jgi:hypothetical protein
MRLSNPCNIGFFLTFVFKHMIYKEKNAFSIKKCEYV